MQQNNLREEKVLNKGSWRHREVATDDGVELGIKRLEFVI